ncbi:MAG: 2-oxoglutarate dehydrogenase E1 component, partial [Gammaproteobacteria bacterium]
MKELSLSGDNAHYFDDLYEQYLNNPEVLEPPWQAYFSSIASVSPASVFEKDHKAQGQATSDTMAYRLSQLMQAYRLSGHLCAQIDPLEITPRLRPPNLDWMKYGFETKDLLQPIEVQLGHEVFKGLLQNLLQDLEQIYCQSIGFQFMHLSDFEERTWLQAEIESLPKSNFDSVEQKRILDILLATEGLEKYLGAKYPGAKRFSLEGCDALIVALDKLIQLSGQNEIEEVVFGMAHRGRLNVLVNILGKVPEQLFLEFEGKHEHTEGSGDVKYHMGFSSDIKTSGKNVHLSLAFNPSHLEIVSPVVLGSVRARLERRNDLAGKQVLAIIMHGDASFAGQGVVMETLNMAQTRGYGTGGSIHIIVNNHIGFTTSHPKDARSTPYCSDLAKMLEVPVFHVNADDPEALCKVAILALKYRQKYAKDVVIDISGYRRQGHNEADEPSATQPLMYQKIKQHPTALSIYANKLIALNSISDAAFKAKQLQYREDLDARNKVVAKDCLAEIAQKYAVNWKPFTETSWRNSPNTAVPHLMLKVLATSLVQIPEGFSPHARLKKILEDRRNMAAGNQEIDWGFGELLAYASLLAEGFHVRISGQDCGRGTFFHRHAVLHDQNTGQCYAALEHLSSEQGRFRIIDSLLSEMAVLGFEFGYAASEPKCLTIWEAQFGDFANGAQVVIDQFISSSEQKWQRYSGLVMFLPHGYEGQGPEHSSARVERYLQLCAQENIQVIVPSTPGQVFHMLRRQMMRMMRKPLIVFTPKSLLRHPKA